MSDDKLKTREEGLSTFYTEPQHTISPLSVSWEHIISEYENAAIAAAQFTQPTLSFTNSDGVEIIHITADGNVYLAEGLSPNEASQHFWERLREVGLCKDVVMAMPEEDVDTARSYAIDQMVETIYRSTAASVSRSRDTTDDQEEHNRNYERAMKVVR